MLLTISDQPPVKYILKRSTKTQWEMCDCISILSLEWNSKIKLFNGVLRGIYMLWIDEATANDRNGNKKRLTNSDNGKESKMNKNRESAFSMESTTKDILPFACHK